MSGEFLQTSRPVLDWVLRTTWEASLIAALVLAAQVALRGRVSARWRYNLWLLVVARLLLPAVPGSHYSPFNLVRLPQPAQPSAAPARLGPRINPTPPPRVIPVPGPAQAPENREPLYLASDLPAEPLTVVPMEPVVAAAPAPLPALRSEVAVNPAPSTARASASVEASPRWHREVPRPAVGSRQRSVSATPVPTQAPRVPWHGRVNWLAVSAVAWVAGAAFVAARVLWVTLRLSGAVRGLPAVRDPTLDALLHECAAQLKVRRLPEVLEAPDSFGPALVGIVRPRVVLPRCVLRGSFRRDELRLILMHELAHMKRWDVAANWLLAVLGAVHWFNPVLGFAFRRMRADRELACDELVLSATAPAVARAYGPTILKLLQTLSRGTPVPGVVGVLEGKHSIRRRIAMIARFDRSNRNSSPLLGVALSALAGGVALTGAVRGQQAPTPQPVPADVRGLSVELRRDDVGGQAGEAEERVRAARRDAEDHDRAAEREAEDQARQAAREAEDQAREQAEDARQQALDASRESLDEARQRVEETRQELADKQREAAEQVNEADQAAKEARRQFDEQQEQMQQEIAEARKQLDAAQLEAVNHEQALRKELDEAKQALVNEQASKPAEGDDDAAQAAQDRLKDLTSAVEDKERELAEASQEREQALKEARAELERSEGERQTAIKEAQDEIARGVAERQAAVEQAQREIGQAAAEHDQARAQLAAAEQAAVRAQLAAQPKLPTPAVGAAPETAPTGAPVAGEAPATAEPAPAQALPPVTPGELPSSTPPIGVGPAGAAPATTPPIGTGPVVAGQPATGLPVTSAAPAGGVAAVAPAADPAAAPRGATAGAGRVTSPAPAQPARRNGPANRGAAMGMGGYGGAMMGGAGGMGGQPGYPTPGPGGYGGGYGGGYPGMGGMGGRRAGAAPAPGQSAHVEDPTARAADARTTQLLRKTLTINFDNIGLSDVLQFVSENAQVDVVVDWKGLEAAGVEKNAPVSLTLRQGAPAEQVLTWVLRSATGDAAGFAIDHGVVLVAPQDRINQMVVTRAYPLGNLAGDGAALEQLVRDTVAPGAWRETGGPGAVRCFNGQLFVTATEPNHRQVERLLGLMQAQGVAPRGGAGAMAPGMPMMPGMGGMPGMMPGGAPAPQPK